MRKDKRILRTDPDIRRVLGVTEEVDMSIDPKDPNGLNFFTLQKHIAKVYQRDK